MSESLIVEQSVLDYACHKRGLCCRRDWDVDLTAETWAALQSASRDSARYAAVGARALQPVDGELFLPRDHNGACVFLDGALCGVRLHLDDALLPRTCRAYPYLVQRRARPGGDAVVVGLDFTCPTAAHLLASQPFQVSAPDHDALPAAERDFYAAIADDYTHPAIVYAIARARVRAIDFWQVLEAVVRMEAPDAASLLEAAFKALAEDGLESPPPAPALRARAADPLPPEPFVQWARAHDLPRNAVIAWWQPVDVSAQPDAPDAADESSDALLLRYARHRLWMPIFLGAVATGHRLVAGVAALCARVALARARGYDFTRAVRAAEQVLLADAAMIECVSTRDLFAPALTWIAMLRALHDVEEGRS